MERLVLARATCTVIKISVLLLRSDNVENFVFPFRHCGPNANASRTNVRFKRSRSLLVCVHKHMRISRCTKIVRLPPCPVVSSANVDMYFRSITCYPPPDRHPNVQFVLPIRRFTRPAGTRRMPISIFGLHPKTYPIECTTLVFGLDAITVGWAPKRLHRNGIGLIEQNETGRA